MSKEYEDYLRNNPLSLEAQKVRASQQKAHDEANPGAAEARSAADLAAAYANLPPSIRTQVEASTVEKEVIGGHSDGESGVRTEQGSTFIRAGVFSTDQQRIQTEVEFWTRRYVEADAGGDHAAAKSAERKLHQLRESMRYQQIADEQQNQREAQEQEAAMAQMVEDINSTEEHLATMSKDDRLIRRLKIGNR